MQLQNIGHKMMKCRYGKNFLSNKETIDFRKGFLEIYNSVDKTNEESYKTAMKELLEYIKKHFEYEEKLINKFGYPRKDEHHWEHRKIINQIEFFIKIPHSKFAANVLKTYYNEKLPCSFELHLSIMDTELNKYVKSKHRL